MTSITDYVTQAQAADMADLSVHAIRSHRFPGNRRRKTPFPEPAAIIAGRPVWLKTDVAHWVETRDSKRGPIPTSRTPCE